MLTPDLEVWIEAGAIAGTLARTQNYQRHQRKECLNDALILLTAAKAGLLPGDVVIKLDGVDINGVDDLIRALDRDRIGRTLSMDVLRMGRLRAIDIHPVERKPAKQ